MKTFALIVAGGSGVRMGGPLPKQFVEIAGKPILMHTIELFSRFDNKMELIVVLPAAQSIFWEELCRRHRFEIPHQVACGGETRFHSVSNGLELARGDGIVFIHDGVRPLVSSVTLRRCFETAVQHGNAVPAVPVSESVRWVENGLNHPVDRSKLVLIQTPQTFRLPLIQAAYRQPFDPAFTDDASVLEKTGAAIQLVEGNPENIKITWPADLRLAKLMLETETSR